MKNEKEKKPHSWQHTALIVLCVVLAVILAVLLIGTAYIGNLLGHINRSDPSQNTMSPEDIASYLSAATDDIDPTAETLDPTDITWSTDPTATMPEQGENIINILLIGQDRRPGEGRQRSDVMILCTINKSTKTLTLTSFMRDMYVQIPGYIDHKLNSCYCWGGMELLDSTLEKNFGVQVDGNLEVDFNGFINIINLVGGVDIELTASEAKYLNNHKWDIEGAEGWTLKEGVNRLNGAQALAYARTRDVGNSDFDRTNRQRKVLNSLLESCRGLNVMKLDQLLRAALPYITTDLTDAQIMGYALQVFPLLTDLTIVSQRIPANGDFKSATVKGMSVLLPDLDACRRLLAQTLGDGAME